MRKNFKMAVCMGLAAGMVFGSAVSAFAGTWRAGDGANQGKWWYAIDDAGNEWYHDGWQWIDGDGDGVAQCYYFDQDGWMLADTETPDGYSVNANGEWVKDGVTQTTGTHVQSEQVQAEAEPQEAVEAETGVQSTAEFAKYAGVYQAGNMQELVYLGLDESWMNATLTVGDAAVTLNGITVSELMVIDYGITFSIPDINCAAYVLDDGTMTIYHLAGADWAEYRKIK